MRQESERETARRKEKEIREKEKATKKERERESERKKREKKRGRRHWNSRENVFPPVGIRFSIFLFSLSLSAVVRENESSKPSAGRKAT